ncbi:hypothetical protein FHS67_002773 [Aminobacter aminovorans]|jgi:hypothetical protein|uniref:Uncharacterized protein n=1 Tax=Aminobacter aminovorans TaxID=83263 RepID=A0AAC8YM24_AMIAI|nr:hypothetical protein AA2016_1681 [Aminobacter aminovorans]MBB3706451.1 hypothetical protein [Aminobacter aminovorans]
MAGSPKRHGFSPALKPPSLARVFPKLGVDRRRVRGFHNPSAAPPASL